MILKPMIRNNVCINVHPAGCKKALEHQIAQTKRNFTHTQSSASAPKNVLVIGCSGGYGLASRVTAAFGYGATTVGVSFEKVGSKSKWGTPGWYYNKAFDAAAAADKLTAITIEGDAFSDEIKKQVIDAARSRSIQFDLIIYSIASPVRVDPQTGVLHRSVLKPLDTAFSGKALNPFTGSVSNVAIEPATSEELADTVAVMGGEDWERWITQLHAANILANGCITVAYSYIGPESTYALYRNGSIGKAKEHLEATADMLSARMASFQGKSFVSVNKGLVTRASAVIPVIPLYIAALFKVMKSRGIHEGCIEQMHRLFKERLYTSDIDIPVDDKNRIRLDDLEMDMRVQQEVASLMEQVTSENSMQLTDLTGYRHDFLAANGFDIDGINYELDVLQFDTF